MFLHTLFDQFLPPQVRSYIIDALKYYWKRESSDTLTLVFKEKDCRSPNDMFNATEAYLSTIISPDTKRLRDGYKDPGVNLDHPSTFDALAMDPIQKKAIIDDLDLFVRMRDFYKKVGKAWKRVLDYRWYLLYGPPGTGKSSLITAMANYLKFDVYDLQLMNIRSDSILKDMMLQTSNRSVLVIEDIDCSTNIPDRNGTTPSKSKSRIFFIMAFKLHRRLWSCCGNERIIIFTTNHPEKLDHALLRPGRMDMHIHMSYLTFNGFKTLAANYLNIHDDHWRFREIEELIQCNKVTPVEVAGELIKSDNAEVVLDGLVKFLEGKKEMCRCNYNERVDDKGDEVLEAKTDKLYKLRSKTHVD
ncbi:AAA+ ATPase domain-containing protein [Tanacetum coccineum]